MMETDKMGLLDLIELIAEQVTVLIKENIELQEQVELLQNELDMGGDQDD
jgi:cell division septum initiation protein DivIVA